MLFPSKKLVAEILSDYLDEKEISYIDIDNNELLIYEERKNDNGPFIEHDIIFSINIFEFCFKIKKWAYKLGYELLSGISSEYLDFKITNNNIKYICIINLKFEDNGYDGFDIIEEKEFIDNLEVNTIIKAAEYILNKGKK